MKLDVDSLYTVSREDFQRDCDAILEKVEKGAGPILITDQGQPTGPIIDATPQK